MSENNHAALSASIDDTPQAGVERRLRPRVSGLRLFAITITVFPFNPFIGAFACIDDEAALFKERTMDQPKRIALITGGNKGIGLEIARQLGRAGISVLLGCRSSERGQQAAEGLRTEGVDAHPVQVDITDEHSVAHARQVILDRFGSLDILVNNAGINDADDGKPSVASVDAVRRLLETNFLGALTVNHAMVPLLRRAPDATIVNMSSSLGSLAMNGDPGSQYYRAQLIGYNASKAALNMLTVQLAKELAGTRITIDSACPGFVDTDLNGHSGTLSVAEGAALPVRLALMETAVSGQFVDARGSVP